MMFVKLAYTLTLAALLSGCAERSVVDQAVGGNSVLQSKGVFGALATKANFRTVNAVIDKNRFGGYCPEPPPDVAESVSSNLEARIEGVLEGGDYSPEAKAEIKSIVETEISQLINRTSALQYNRDTLYYICVFHLNSRYLQDTPRFNLQKASKAATQKSHDLMLAEIIKGMSKEESEVYKMLKDQSDKSTVQ